MIHDDGVMDLCMIRIVLDYFLQSKALLCEQFYFTLFTL